MVVLHPAMGYLIYGWFLREWYISSEICLPKAWARAEVWASLACLLTYGTFEEHLKILSYSWSTMLVADDKWKSMDIRGSWIQI